MPRNLLKALMLTVLSQCGHARDQDSAHEPEWQLQPRQTTEIFPTLTYSAPVTYSPPANSPTPTGEPPTTRRIGTLTVASTPIPLAATMAMIMPNPWQLLYVGLNYTFGFVDAVPKPAPTIGGWLRTVTPLLIFPDRTVHVFPNTGTVDPDNNASIPYGSDGLCGTSVFDWAVGYPFQFWEVGWYMFIVNQTWVQPTVGDNVCHLPLLNEKAFFSTQTFSIAKYPAITPGPSSPPSAYTVFGAVVTDLPGDLPPEPHNTTRSEALGIGLGVAGAVLALVVMAFSMLYMRKKRRMEAEALAFGRMKPEQQMAFLVENPTSWLNPSNQRPSGFRGPIYHPAHYIPGPVGISHGGAAYYPTNMQGYGPHVHPRTGGAMLPGRIAGYR